MVINPYIFKREPNTFIGGIAKLGGTGANAPVLTAAELAAKMGISESIIKEFKVVGEDVECRITSDYDLKQYAFGNNTSGDANQNITFFNDIDNKCIGSARHSFANCFNLLSVVMNGLKNNVLALGGGTNGGIFRNCTSMISAELDSLEILNCYEFLSSTKLTNINMPSLQIILDTVSTRYRNFQNMTELNILSARKLKQIGADASINNNNFLGIKLNATIEVHIDLATANNGDIDADLLYAYTSRNATINFYDDNGDFVETYNPNPELYTENDACSIGANETESIGAGWVATDSILSIDIGNNSNWCLKATSEASSEAFGGFVRLNISNLEVGATYRVTMDSRSTDITELAAGQGWFEAKWEGGWTSHEYFDILSFEWEQNSIEVTANGTNCYCTLYVAYTSSGPQVGWSCYLDNISIKKIS